MPRVTSTNYVCVRCLRTQRLRAYNNAIHHVSKLSSKSTISPHPADPATPRKDSVDGNGPDVSQQEKERGAMSRRLEEMTDRTIEESGERSRKAFEDAGFSEELKKELEERIAMSSFKSENAAAFAQVDLPVYPSTKGTVDTMDMANME